MKAKIKKEYKIGLCEDAKIGEFDTQSTYLEDFIEADSLSEAYSKAIQIATEINKSLNKTFHIVSIDRRK